MKADRGLTVERVVEQGRVSRSGFYRVDGSAKPSVMAMIIASQTINAVRHPQSKRFTKTSVTGPASHRRRLLLEHPVSLETKAHN